MGAVYSLLKIISNEEKKKLLQNQLKISKWCTCRTWFWCAVFHYFSIWLCMSFLHDQVYFSLLMLQWLFLALFILLLLFFSRVQLFVTPWTAVCHASLSFTSPRVCSNSCPLSWWCYLTISPSAALFSFCFNLSQRQCLFQWVGSLNQVAKMLELQLQHQTFQWIFRVDFH